MLSGIDTSAAAPIYPRLEPHQVGRADATLATGTRDGGIPREDALPKLRLDMLHKSRNGGH